MADYHISSQHNIWKFQDRAELEACRVYTNFLARKYLFERATNTDDSPSANPVSCYACIPEERAKAKLHNPDVGPWESPTGGHKYINAGQEKTLVDFYLGKLPALVGPAAQVRRMRRGPKVVATAAMLYQRFFVSNSVLLFDPKVMMVAAVFLATKTEDSMATTKDLEIASESMQAPVKTVDIVSAEVHLIAGVHFDLHCFHPYKTLESLTEDVRSHLKKAGEHRVSPDWKTIYDAARKLIDESLVQKDVALLYTPSFIGLASLVKAAADAIGKFKENHSDDSDQEGPVIPWQGYLEARFPQKDTHQLLDVTIPAIMEHLSEKHTDSLELVKAVHKQLKKVKAWGGGNGSSKKKKKKRTADADEEMASKKQKVE